MSVNIDKFFRVWDFLKSTPYPVLKSILRQNTLLYSDTHELYRKILTGCSVENNQIKDSSGTVLFTGYKGDRWGLNPVYNLSYPKDLTIIDAALQAREKSWHYFSKVFVPGSFAFNTSDMDLYRKMLIDWNSSSRTFKDLFRRASNVFSLDDTDVDKAIKGFGIDFVNQTTVDNIIYRDLFLLSMCELYKIKGTPQSITKSLELVGVKNAVIREYWIERDPLYYKTLQIRGKAVGKYRQMLDDDPDSITYNQYKFLSDPDNFDDSILTWENFQTRLWDIGDPHWWYTNDEIIAIDYSSNTKIKLPSITPYFGIQFNTEIEKYNILMAILENIMSNQINSILSGNKDLVPQEIGVNGYNEELSERDLWISGYDQPLSLVECFLGFAYAQIRYDDLISYNQLQEFMFSHGVQSMPEYQYPHGLHELIYWAWQNKDTVINGVYTVDSVLRMYKRKKSNYYCSTNELIDWWLTKDASNYWNSSTDNNMDQDLFNILFSDDYSFQYNQERRDTDLDQILFYSGSRKLNFKQQPFEYFETMGDAQRSLATQTNRLPFDSGFKSDLPSNYGNNYYELLAEAQEEFRNTYYNYISWVPSDYIDRSTHDGSTITPYYKGKYPRCYKWNWGIDSNYLYINTGAGKWIRKEVETVIPDQDILDSITTLTIGYEFYQNQYVYKYISTDIWVRYEVETEWEYCEGAISTTGHIKLSSDIAHKTIKAKIDPAIAAQYISDKTQLLNATFDIVMSPLSSNPTTLQYDVRKLESFISTYALTLDSNGYLKTDFSYLFDDPKLYIRVTDVDTQSIVWVRTPFETEWTVNGTAMFAGGYRYPNLDLTNRYDAERILRGVNVLKSDELNDVSLYPGTTNNGEILVCQGSSGHPETWYWNGSNWAFNPINRINDINLGVNPGLVDWIDSSVAGDETKYETYATRLLSSLSTYVKTSFQDPTFDVAGIYKNIRNGGVYKDLIDFFKPKRARLLYLSIDLNFNNDKLYNSIIVDERIETTKIIQEINDRVQRNDGVYIRDDNGVLYKEAYHQDDVTKSIVIPVNSEYGEAVYYLKDFEDQRLNGFYFYRPDLSENGKPYYLNYHNVALAYITNSEKINGTWNQWILSLRKRNLDWCDAICLNYSENPYDGNWILRSYQPEDSTSSSSSSIIVSGLVMPVNNVTFDDLRPCDINVDVSLDGYEIGKTNQWNVIKDIIGNVLDLPFTGNANDHSGNGNNGIVHNNPRMISRDGDSNTCYSFDGNNTNDQYIEVDTITATRAVLSLSYWFKVNDASVDQSIYSSIWDYGSGGSDPDNGMHWRGRSQLRSGKLFTWHVSYYSNPVDDTSLLQGITNIQNNTWYHVYEEINRITGITKLYLNGMLEATTTMKTVAQGYYNEERYFWIGRRKFDSHKNFAGEIDNFKVFDYPLTESQIKTLSKIQRRPEPQETEKIYDPDSISLKRWNQALCKDPINFRRIFPVGGSGYPENIEGERLSGWDADLRNPGKQEFSYSLWRKEYPYSDDELTIHDAATPPIGLRDSPSTQLQSLSNYNSEYLNPYYGITNVIVTQTGSGYSNNTIVCIRNNGQGKDAVLTPVIVGGKIQSVTVTSSGHYLCAPEIFFYDSTGTGSGAEATATVDQLTSTIPQWWIRNPDLFYSGPVNHRPVYIAVEHTIHDCYPLIDLGACCDYYDTGCRHDGPTNPRVVIWVPITATSSSSGQELGGWTEGQYSEYSIRDLNYDVFTKHHKIRGFVSGDEEYWNNEPNWAGKLINPGDTYCHDCDDPLFTPDVSFFTLPDNYKHSGVYHNVLIGTNFPIASLNGEWRPTNSLESLKEFDFPVGYTNCIGDELVHVYHRPSGYHYWEIRSTNIGAINVLNGVTIRNDLDFTFDTFMTVGVNCATNSYIQLYDASTVGSIQDDTKIYYVNKNNEGSKTASTYIEYTINGSKYWVSKYVGDNYTPSASRIISIEDSSSTFEMVGFVMINVNNTESKYIKVYTMV